MTETVDLIVIGGGINGAGIARDAAERGLSVALLEKDDFGGGTSSWSSRLIHGGLRYLEYAEIPLVYESLHERKSLLKIAPHLVKPLPISIPIYKGAKRGRWLVRAGMLAYDLLSMGKEMPRHQMLSARAFLTAEPGVESDGLVAAARYYDAQVTFAERLVLENILAAEAAGARPRNYCTVERLIHDDGRIRGVSYRSMIDGDEHELRARAVVNAAGPWVDYVLARSDLGLSRFMGGTKGSHIVVAPFSGAPTDAFYVEARSDGRPVFIIPWNGQYLIGTTDIRFDGDLDKTAASAEEVDYLLAETNKVFPNARLSRESVHFTYCGVRPLPFRRGGPEAAITRKHIIRHHKKAARGLYSIIGGKLTTYRNLARECVDIVARELQLSIPRSQTDVSLLPGGQNLAEVGQTLQDVAWLGDKSRDHLHTVYGSRAADVLKVAQESQEMRKIICPHSGALAAEVVFAVRHEYALTLADVLHRRTMIALGPRMALDAAPEVARIMASHCGWEASRTEKKLREYRQDVLRFAPPAPNG